MALLVLSFVAGALTVLAPCILPVLPIIIGRSVGTEKKHRPLVIVGSLAIGVVVFTLLLKASTLFIEIPQSTWSYVSGSIIGLFGLIYLFPHAWESISTKLNLSTNSNKLLAQSAQKKGVLGDIFIGLSLGPVFSSCSPTYFLILATVLPESYSKGVLYLIAYALGLSVVLLLISLLGQRFVKHLNIAADPEGWFKRGLGILFLLVGIFIASGLDKTIQTGILENGFFDITKVEQHLLQESMDTEEKELSHDYEIPYVELVNPSGFVNSDPFKIADYIGERVILLDFMTYSCINCQRTFPYLNAWYETYKDDGLIVIGIHTPEFAFEHNIENVKDAAERFGLAFPIALDNDYETWRAYENRYWPRKYLIDIHGNIVYDHIGEGAYDETETKIRELLEERSRILEDSVSLGKTVEVDAETPESGVPRSPETYLGTYRNTTLGIVQSIDGNTVTFSRPTNPEPNQVYLVGTWMITGEYSQAVSEDAAIIYNYSAKDVFLVMGADGAAAVVVKQDGSVVTDDAGIHVEKNGEVIVEKEQLYRLIEQDKNESHILELEVEPGIQAFAFTFG